MQLFHNRRYGGCVCRNFCKEIESVVSAVDYGNGCVYDWSCALYPTAVKYIGGSIFAELWCMADWFVGFITLAECNCTEPFLQKVKTTSIFDWYDCRTILCSGFFGMIFQRIFQMFQIPQPNIFRNEISGIFNCYNGIAFRDQLCPAMGDFSGR